MHTFYSKKPKVKLVLLTYLTYKVVTIFIKTIQ